jgi:anti-sigma factor RsiW
MSQPREALLEVLRQTADREIDCGTFADMLAAFVDDGLSREERALMEQHRIVCPECDEELTLLLTALGADA